MATVTGSGSVSKSATATSAIAARNFPSTSRQVGTGSVASSSSVPARRSSLHSRIVSAAAKKISNTGIQSNKGRMSAIFRAKKASTQKNTNRQAARKVPIKR